MTTLVPLTETEEDPAICNWVERGAWKEVAEQAGF